MTRISVNITDRHTRWKAELQQLLPLLATVPMVVFGSPDVQVNTHVVWGEIGQWAFEQDEDGHVVRPVISSSISLEMLHVHDEADATQADNDLAAGVALATIWGTLVGIPPSNPNVLVLQNGSTSYGWAEGMRLPDFAEKVVQILDDFHEAKVGRKEARLALHALFQESPETI